MHGRETKINFFMGVADATLAAGLLYWGGFFG